MTHQPVTHLYRSLLRELRFSSKQPTIKRSPIVVSQVRQLVSSIQSEDQLSRTLMETRDFLRSSRIYGDLLKRYNPLHDMSDDERIRATARRVGLDAPTEYKPPDQ
ncbi:uncharacterized protein MKK02DRAFT_30705 [Dioszegia hungarica]|uniref:Complex 1 LYR protein n=1 Tax=Dioszegia hungarica TaxID=4972 RepID=A0AA38LSR4_9TREE|nr:uncharacterized protein MKK02DRAFT_30705 [Dioszegia hungarica]KAI9631696.1 hypothetical protein MKK02DRAFT_30705 [Dioszegia hungarica]